MHTVVDRRTAGLLPGEHPVTVVDGRWPFAARDTELKAVRAVLAADPGHGAVLVGPSGVGKTMIVQQVLASLSRQVDHMYLRGSAAHAATPYGALNVLLAELDLETARSPLLVLSALQRRFDGGTAGRRTLVHIDGVEHIDELSATVMAHLARVGSVRLVVTCEDILRAPAEFLDLWKDGVLTRFDIRPLTREGATAMLTAALGAPVSRTASYELWAASGGNPRYLQLAAKADVTSGHLFRRDGVWVSRDAPRPDAGRSVTDWTPARLADLDPGHRVALEVLAVSGAVPVSLVLPVVPAAALDALEESGVLTVEPAGTPLVRITHEVLADVVRSQLTSQAGQEALTTLAALRTDPAMPSRAGIALALWLLERGEPFTAGELVALADTANSRRIDGAAERFLGAVGASGFDASGFDASGFGAAAALERARHLYGDGRLTDAVAAVDPLLAGSRPGQEPDFEHWVGVRLLAAQLFMRLHERAWEAPALLDDVARRLTEEPAAASSAPDADRLADLAARVDVLRLELHLFEGDLVQVIKRAPEALAERREGSRWTTRIRSMVAVATSAIGAQEDAVEHARRIGARLADPAAAVADRGLAAAHLFGILFAAGRWAEAHHLLRGPAGPAGSTGSGTLLFTGSSAECAEGAMLSFLGRSEEALEKLTPAIGQLRVRDRHGLLPLAEAAAAYAHVLEGRRESAEDHLRAVDLTSERHSWHFLEAVEYFRLLTDAWLDSPAGGVDGFLAHARDLGDAGYHGIELFFLAQAVQLGGEDAVGSLAAVARAGEGTFAALGGSFASALAAGDAGALRDTAWDALEIGYQGLANDIAALSTEYSEETDDPMIRVHAEQILRRTSTPARRHVRRKLLSERERVIARMVAQGVPNKEIARREHISHRTVEGHVHQVMTKLGLSSRKQLALIFGPQP